MFVYNVAISPECEASRISPCRHANNLSTNLFGDCEAYGVWPTKSFYPVLVWPLRVLSHVFLASVMSDQRKHSHSLYT